MTPLFTFLIESSLLLALGTLVYVVLLRKSGWHQGNRFFLLLWPLVSLLLAWIRIPIPGRTIWVEAAESPEFSAGLPLAATSTNEAMTGASTIMPVSSWPTLLFWSGVVVVILHLLIRLLRMVQLIRGRARQRQAGYTLVEAGNDLPVSSFGRYLFWPQGKPLSGPMFEHELVHIRQQHTLDRILMELTLALFWYHPLMYFLRRELRDIHEYIADAAVTRHVSAYDYAMALIHYRTGRSAPPLVHPFSQHIKKRLRMLHHPTVKTPWRFLSVLPLLGLSIFFFSCEAQDQFVLEASPESAGHAQAVSIAVPDPLTEDSMYLIINDHKLGVLTQEEAVRTLAETNGGKTDRLVRVEPPRAQELGAPAGMVAYQIYYATDGQSLNFRYPLPAEAGELTSGFGQRIHPVTQQQQHHRGLDLKAPRGTSILASAAGTVKEAKYDGGYGNCVILDHGNGVLTRYAHMSEILVETGSKVAAGALIGRVGSTGRSAKPHLHFEILKDGKPIDPDTYLKKS